MLFTNGAGNKDIKKKKKKKKKKKMKLISLK